MNRQATIPMIYPVVPENEMMTKNGRLERIISQQPPQGFIMGRSSFSGSRLLVRAANILNENSTTEIIDANMLSQRNITVMQHSVIEIIETGGKLRCVNELINPSNWLKSIALATDSQSYNVLLMISNGGVILRTIRKILPEEPLLMWFADCILTILNIPFITAQNCIVEGMVYTCHICNRIFEYPNPLKLHLALDCNRKDNNCIWTFLANKIVDSQRTDFRQYPGGSFTFKLNPLPDFTQTTLPIGIPLYSSLTMNTSQSLRNSSACSLNKQSLLSSNDPSPISSSINNLRNCHSTSRSYLLPNLKDMHPADVERIASDMGKCSTGYKCIFCKKMYSRKYGLRIHIRTHSRYKPLKCKACYQHFSDPSNLNKHVRLHATDDSPYKCEICGKVLVRRRDLERHINSRHADRNEGFSSSSEND